MAEGLSAQATHRPQQHPAQSSPTPTTGLGSNIKGQALRVPSQVLSAPSCLIPNTHHHPAAGASWFHSVLLQATPPLRGAKEKGGRHRQAPIINQAGPVLPCRRLEDVHLSVYARTRTHTHTHAHTRTHFVHSNFYKLKIHTQSEMHSRNR